jgi:hexosaminidase
VRKNGKVMMGWDEILHPDLPKAVVVHSWRGQESLAAAARDGHGTLLSNGYYLDLMWPAARYYAVDPMSGDAATLAPDAAKRILGGEACMWAEYITPETIDSRIWPRMAAVAERFWSPQNITDERSMYERLDEMNVRLGWLGLTHESNYVPMLRRLAGQEDIRALRVLADVVEPTKDYTRSEVWPQPPVKRVPLNRLVDAARPESAIARHFAEAVAVYSASGYKDPASEGQLRSWLVKWQANHDALKPVLEQSFLLTEVTPLSEDLAALSAAALQSLDAIKSSQPLSESWRTEQLARVKRSLEPRANLVMMIASPIQTLIEAASPHPATP